VAELKQILKKDFNRRLVEGTAFKGKVQFDNILQSFNLTLVRVQ
jgi:hypothetical protein